MNDRLKRLKQILQSIPKSEQNDDNHKDLTSLNGYLTRRDFDCLNAPNYLNDNVIFYYLCHLFSNISNAMVFDPLFYSSVVKNGKVSLPSLEKWTKRKALNFIDSFFLPLNTGNHWILIAIMKNEKNIYFYALDSLNVDRVDLLIEVFQVFQHLLNISHDNCFFTIADTPKQENGYDCGLYLLKYAELLSRSKDIMVNFCFLFRKSFITSTLIGSRKEQSRN